MPDPIIANDCELLAEEVEAMMFEPSLPAERKASDVVEALLAYGMRVGEA